MPRELQFVWPKDGPQGRSGHRGFFGRLNNIVTNRGPDVFLQRKGSKRPIPTEVWGNWDSYADYDAHDQEEGGAFYNRGFKRYDPHSRKYKTWNNPHDWYGVGVNGHGEDAYPRYTRGEMRKNIRHRVRSGRPVDPSRMGSEWSSFGPKRFRAEHDWFWQEAHRYAENRRERLSPFGPINPFFSMAQRWAPEVDLWGYEETF
ncbi:hypothetical protein BGZ60DRAFT_525785 [Tricladium varicosporioides]|nr:hypothetical protein BGZ60DRAFT_525785 [Hymenoscyphus varicosporioides]